MSNSSYHSETDSLSTSQFKVFLGSATEYNETFRLGRMSKKKPTTVMEVGTIGHAVLLEKKSIDDICREYPTSCLKSDGGLNSKPAAEFREKIFPLIAVKSDTIEQVEAIVASVRLSPLAELLDNSAAMFERRLDAVVEGVKVRCKPDIHSVIDDTAVIFDLKFTERIRPDDFWRTARQMQYFIQDAFYSVTAETLHEVPSTFRFWAIETVYPYRVRPYWYDDRSREIAKEFVKKKLNEFRERDEANNWNDDWEPTGTVGPWDLGQHDNDEIVEFEG